MEYVNKLTPGGMSPYFLNLKQNCCVMLLRNLSLLHGFCNGTELRVRRIMNNLLEVENVKTLVKSFLPRIPMTSEETGFPFKMRRLQFPIRLGYAMTINKSQGQTLDRTGLYLKSPVFDHGQLYVAFSRVRTMENIKVLVFNKVNQGILPDDEERHRYTHNIVYRELLTGETRNQNVIHLNLNDNSQSLSFRCVNAQSSDQSFEDFSDYQSEDGFDDIDDLIYNPEINARIRDPTEGLFVKI